MLTPAVAPRACQHLADFSPREQEIVLSLVSAVADHLHLAAAFRPHGVVAAKDLGKVVGKVGEVEHLDRAGNQRVAGGFEGDDSWVGLVLRSEDLIDNRVAPGVGQRIDRGDFLHGDDGVPFDIGILERDAATGPRAFWRISSAGMI